MSAIVGTTTYTHNEHSVQCEDTHYEYVHYGKDIPIVDTLNMDTPLIGTSIMGVITMGLFIMRAAILDTIKMDVSNMDTSIKGTHL